MAGGNWWQRVTVADREALEIFCFELNKIMENEEIFADRLG